MNKAQSKNHQVCFNPNPLTKERLEKVMQKYGSIIKLRLLGEYGLRAALDKIEDGKINEVIEVCTKEK